MSKWIGMVMGFVLAAAGVAGAQSAPVGADLQVGPPGAVGPVTQQEQGKPGDPQTPKAPGEEDQEKVPDRPLRGLFGGSWIQRPGTALTVSIFEEYTNDLRQASDEYPIRSLVQRNGYFGGMRANLTYDRRRETSTLAFRSEGSGRYYPDIQEYSIPRFRSEMDFMKYVNGSKSSKFRVGQRVDYQPYYTLPVAGTLVTPALDRVGLSTDREDHLVGRQSYISDTNGSYDRHLSARTLITIDSGYRFTYSEDPNFDVTDFRVGGRALHLFTPTFGVRSGAGYRHGTLPGGPLAGVLKGQDFDLGIEYNRPVSKTRRAFFSGSVGGAVLDIGLQRIRFVTANGSVKYDTPDRWSLQLDVDRGVRLIEGFRDPVFSNGVMMRFSGLIGPRIEASFEAGGAVGQVGDPGRRYHNVQGAAQIRYAFNRYLAVEGQGLVYQYDFDPTTTLIDFLPRAMNRRGGRISLVIWLPVTQ